jgi:hypothetical protein
MRDLECFISNRVMRMRGRSSSGLPRDCLEVHFEDPTLLHEEY